MDIATRQRADSIIIECLREAGAIGLHVGDIIPLVGLKGRKPTLQRLFLLQRQGKTEQIPGQRWRINITPSAIIPKAGIEEPPESSNELYNSANIDYEVAKEEFQVSPSLPEIMLPGKPKFSSYKNSLQEYCQKLGLALPQYQSMKQPEGGYFSKVSFATNVVSTQRTFPNAKDSESLAAFESLKQLGYFSEEIQFEHTKLLKRKALDGDDFSSEAKVFRQTESGLKYSLPPDIEFITSFKSLLNEVAQKNRLPTPLYETESGETGFISTVTFKGRDYKGSKTFSKKRDAEQNAARVALHVLIKLPLAEPEEITDIPSVTQNDVNQMISAARKVKIQKELKNRLQEYSQRMDRTLPAYSVEYDKTTRKFTASVLVVGKRYDGEVSGTRKLAERSAAEVALKSLGIMVTK